MLDSAQKGEPRFLAVIGDICRSRDSKRRAQLQKQIESGLQQTNRELKKSLAAGFVVTLGDEFQGLLADPGAGMRALISLESALPNIPIRYALGWGELATEIRRLAVGMDGPCFHAAREAMTRGKRLDRWVTVSGFGADQDDVVNGIFALIGSVRAGWTPIQAQTITLMRHYETQKQVAAARKVAVSTVSKALAGALYGPMIEAEKAMEKILAKFAILDAGQVRAGRLARSEPVHLPRMPATRQTSRAPSSRQVSRGRRPRHRAS